MNFRTKYFALFVLLLSLHCIAGNRGFSGNTPGAGIRFVFGPAYGFYKINANHAKNAVPRMSASFGFRKEVRCDREYKTFFLFGVDYFFHGVSFDSYYFKKDSLHLYDKTFGYKYNLFTQELDLPLQFKYSFKRENNSVFSPYVMIGYHLRYLLPAHVNIVQNGVSVKDEYIDVDFRNPFIYKKINSFLSFSAGWQKNSINRSKGSFFVEANVRYGFSQYYFEREYAPSSMFINATHLSLLIGLKF